MRDHAELGPDLVERRLCPTKQKAAAISHRGAAAWFDLLARSRSLAGGSTDGSWVNSRCPLPSDLCPLGRCPLGAFLGGPALCPLLWRQALCRLSGRPLPSALCPLPCPLALPSALTTKNPLRFLTAGFSHQYSRQRPTLPWSCPHSTIGGIRLNFRVRNGNGCGPDPMTTGNLLYASRVGFWRWALGVGSRRWARRHHAFSARRKFCKDQKIFDSSIFCKRSLFRSTLHAVSVHFALSASGLERRALSLRSLPAALIPPP